MEAYVYKYEPSPRFAPFAAAIGGKFYVWGGATKDSQWKSKEYASTIEIFDPVSRLWSTSTASGDSPVSALYNGTSTCMNNSLYIYSGYDGESANLSLYELVVNTDNDSSTVSCTWSRIGDGLELRHCKMLGYRKTIIHYGGSTAWDYRMRALNVKNGASKGNILSVLQLHTHEI